MAQPRLTLAPLSPPDARTKERKPPRSPWRSSVSGACCGARCFGWTQHPRPSQAHLPKRPSAWPWPWPQAGRSPATAQPQPRLGPPSNPTHLPTAALPIRLVPHTWKETEGSVRTKHSRKYTVIPSSALRKTLDKNDKKKSELQRAILSGRERHRDKS